MPSAGELRERVAFDKQHEIETSPYTGTTLSEWETQFTCAARIRPLVGTEPVVDQRLAGVQPFVITVRSSRNSRLVDTSFRLRNVRTGAQFQIRSVTPDERRGWIDILCDGGTGVSIG